MFGQIVIIPEFSIHIPRTSVHSPLAVCMGVTHISSSEKACGCSRVIVER